jgi:hypothetical protein
MHKCFNEDNHSAMRLKGVNNPHAMMGQLNSTRTQIQAGKGKTATVFTWLTTLLAAGGFTMFPKVLPCRSGQIELWHNVAHTQEAKAWATTALTEIARLSQVSIATDRKRAEELFTHPYRVSNSGVGTDSTFGAHGLPTDHPERCDNLTEREARTEAIAATTAGKDSSEAGLRSERSNRSISSDNSGRKICVHQENKRPIETCNARVCGRVRSTELCASNQPDRRRVSKERSSKSIINPLISSILNYCCKSFNDAHR